MFVEANQDANEIVNPIFTYQSRAYDQSYIQGMITVNYCTKSICILYP